jgi:apolipoprotein N-acyltransferase
MESTLVSMTSQKPSRRHRVFTPLRIFGILALFISAAELLLCFAGPMAFIQKPTLMVFSIFSASITDEREKERASGFIEREIARTNSFEILSESVIEEYFLRTGADLDRSKLKPDNYLDAQRLAKELGLARFAIAIFNKTEAYSKMTVWIRNVKYDGIIRSSTFTSDTLDRLLRGIDRDGQELPIQEELRVDTRGIGLTDFMVLGLIGFQFLVGVIALFGREPGILAEIVLAPALVLFLFAFIYAQNANMDYVQRFIAAQGRIRLARSTALEQFYAFLRYGPFLLINGWYYVMRIIRRNRKEGRGRKKSWLASWVSPWALPWVILSAALFALSFPSFVRLDGIGPLAWICLVPLFLVLLTTSAPKGIFYGVVFGVLQTLIINYWHGTYKYVTLHMITIAFVVEYLIFMVVLVWLIKKGGKWGFLIAAAAWVLFDYCRSIGYLGYPWGFIGTTQYQFLPLIQIASVTGIWGISFVVLLCNTSLAWALAAPSFGWRYLPGRTASGVRATRVQAARIEQRGPKPLRRVLTLLRVRDPRSLFPVGVFAALFIACLVAGGVILQTMQTRLYKDPEVPSANVVLVQQNTDPRKHEYQQNLRRLMSLTDEALAGTPVKPDLVVWPEGGTKLDIRYWTKPEKRNTYWGRFVQEFLEFQKNMGTWLLTGTQDHEMLESESGESEKRNYNSSVLLDPQGNIRDFYHKIRLVPFSEYFPLDKERFAPLYELLQNYDISNWGVGDERLVYQHEKMRFFTPICFEDVFPDHVRRFVLRDADVILNISNDYWSLSPVEGKQHGILALFRAVENHRPVLRSTSSGYTVYIDAVGRIQPGSPEPYTAGYTIARVPLPEKKLTVYTRWGDWFPIACGFALLALIAAAAVTKTVRWLWGIWFSFAAAMSCRRKDSPSRNAVSSPSTYKKRRTA